MKRRSKLQALAAFFSLLPAWSLAATNDIDLTSTWPALLALTLFVAAYVLVIGEEALHLRKSKPVILAAGVIWVLVAASSYGTPYAAVVLTLFEHSLLEFAELFLFLLVAMTYINTMEERGVFNLLRARLVSYGFSLRQLFWLTGALAFVMSPLADNLTTALLLSAVVLRVAPDAKEFIVVACINIVVAANAGGAFSPFGDITTLMVWQHGALSFSQFFALVPPSLINWLVPAVLMSFTISSDRSQVVPEVAVVERGGWVVVGLFLGTIAMAVLVNNLLDLPAVLGMMTGFGVLALFGYYLKCKGDRLNSVPYGDPSVPVQGDERPPYDIYGNLARAEWDTLLFFYGIILCVGGLGAFGYLAVGSEWMYGSLGQTNANILVGLLSAVIDNIPVMFAVLVMDPTMDDGQWLLVTLAAGVGGSLLSIGSAAGVAVMGQARGVYTFFSHLRWSWAILLGYAASIAVHMWVNAGEFVGV